MNETDPKQLCRICLSEGSLFSNIFVGQSSEENPIYEIINYVYDLDITINDGLSEYVCRECLRIVKEFETYKRNAHKSKRELLLLREKNNVFVKVEVDDYFDSTDSQVAADGQIYESQVMQKEGQGCYDSTGSPELSSQLGDVHCSRINYVEYHESETMNNDQKSFIKQEPGEVERNCSVNKITGSNNPRRVRIVRTEREKKERRVKGKEVQKGKRKDSQVIVKSEDGFSDEDYIICHHCGEKSKTKIELKEHICRAHLSTLVGDERGGDGSECSRKSFICPLCQKEFMHRYVLTKHLKIHNGIKPHKCNICSYSTVNVSHLRRHIYHVHNGDKPFKCNRCEYSTTVESRLKSHVERHTKEMRYKCDKCDFKVSRKARFISHMRKHIDKKPFKCDVCDYGTAFEPVLRSHMYMHIGEKPFCCDICKYGTTKRSTLRAHMYKHTGERPFKCHICEFSSRTVSDLKRHIRVHTGEKPLKCHLCEYSTADYSNMRKHIHRHQKGSI